MAQTDKLLLTVFILTLFTVVLAFDTPSPTATSYKHRLPTQSSEVKPLNNLLNNGIRHIANSEFSP